MLDVLQFVFSSFWIWAGTVVLVLTVGTALMVGVAALWGGR